MKHINKPSSYRARGKVDSPAGAEVEVGAGADVPIAPSLPVVVMSSDL